MQPLSWNVRDKFYSATYHIINKDEILLLKYICVYMWIYFLCDLQLKLYRLLSNSNNVKNWELKKILLIKGIMARKVV